MTLVRLNPLRDFPEFHSNITSVFDDFFPEITRENKKNAKVFQPYVDIHETETSTFITADLPGLKKEDISINVEENILSLKGERTRETKEEKDNYYKRERFFGKFKREFTLPASVNHEKIIADYNDGVLTIEIPKPEEQKAKAIAIH